MTSPIIKPEFARLIPPLSPEELAGLEAALIADGCRDALVTWGGVLLDGHNRLEICKRRGLNFKTTEIELPDGNAKAWIIRNQFGRRNITLAARCQLAEQLAEALKPLAKENQLAGLETSSKRGGKVSSILKNPIDSWQQAAKEAGVSVGSMHAFAFVKEHGDEKTINELLTNKQAKLHSVAADLKRNISKAKRRDGLKSATWPAGKFRVIYADPPWPYNDQRLGSVEGGGATGTYDTMTLEAICQMNIPGMSLPESVLFLWVTSPLLPDGMTVIKAWGFTYKASFVWDKVRGFNGHYNDVQHEFLLVGTRGSCLPEVSELPDSVIKLEKTKHSKKPGEFAELIDRLYPSGPRVELFARQQRKGWTTWGDQIH